jgi:hypothetical protein
MRGQLPTLPPGGYQQLAANLGQPQASYAFNPVTDSEPFDEAMLGEDVSGTPMDRSMGMEMGMEMGMPLDEEQEMPMNDANREMAIQALQERAASRQAASDSFQGNATKLAQTMRGPQSLV